MLRSRCEVDVPPLPLSLALTLEPAFGAPSWTALGTQDRARLGDAVAVGDVDGDGFADLVAGAPAFDGLGADGGRAVLYPGSPAGLSAAPSWAVDGPAAASLGSSVAMADVDADGFRDLVVGALYDSDGELAEGIARLYPGSPAGPSAVPAWTAEGDRRYAGSGGLAVASAGDVDGDGFEDVVVGWKLHPESDPSAGLARLYRGSAAGLGAAPAWSAAGAEASAHFGASVAGAGDVDGDGFDDVIVGAPDQDGDHLDEGAVYLYRGSAAGLSATPGWIAWGGEAQGSFGAVVAPAGDVNGDGYDDVIVGAPRQGGTGAAHVYFGSAAGLSATPAWSGWGLEPDGQYGLSVGSAGDLDRDGFGDVIVGAFMEDHPDGGPIVVGSASVYLGSAAGLGAVRVWSAHGEQTWAWFGSVVGAAGDVDGDGFGDVFVASPEHDGGGLTNRGRVDVFTDVWRDADGDGVHDAEDVCPAAPDPGQADLDGDGSGDACDAPLLALGGLVEAGAVVDLVASGAVPGEVVTFWLAPGDGGVGPCPPRLGGACLETGGATLWAGTRVADADGVATRPWFVPNLVPPDSRWVVQASIVRGVGGADSVTSALLRIDGEVMDWDGDGLTDAEERALGTGLRDPDSDDDGLDDGLELPRFDPLVPDGDADGVLDGADRCWVGDDAREVDGDGTPDACDLCPLDPDPRQRDADEDGLGDACDGAVLVASRSWSAEGDQAEASFGGAVASAGDVDGDGYGDVIVGAFAYDRTAAQDGEGLAVVYLGSAQGLGLAASWSAQGVLANEGLGSAVASAGDVDGDGFGDVIVGASGHSAGGFDAGAAYVYQGSPTGLAAAPGWTVLGGARALELGASVASAGDVDGDGLDDVIVGAPGHDALQQGGPEGQALVYLGSAAGLDTTPAWTATGGDDHHLGWSVASAGDVDGDGYADVIVGGYRQGPATLFLGGAAGPSPAPAWVEELPGSSGASAGDLDGDGFGDVVVGAPDHGADREGLVRVYPGSPAGLANDPAWSVAGDTPSLELGGSVATAGDVDGDGFDDLLLGVGGSSGADQERGHARLYLGSAMGLAASPAWADEGVEGSRYGAAVASAGDVNADGRSDVVVGAPSATNPESREGRVVLYLGRRP